MKVSYYCSGSEEVFASAAAPHLQTLARNFISYHFPNSSKMAKHLPLNNLRPMLGPLNNRRRVELRPLRRPRRLPHWRVLRPLPPQPTHKPRSLPRLLRHHPPHVKNRNRNLLALRRRPHLLVLRRLPLHLHRHPPPPLRLPRPQPPHAFRGWRPRPPLLRRRSLNTYRSRPRSSSRRKGSHVRTWPVQKKIKPDTRIDKGPPIHLTHFESSLCAPVSRRRNRWSSNSRFFEFAEFSPQRSGRR